MLSAHAVTSGRPQTSGPATGEEIAIRRAANLVAAGARGHSRMERLLEVQAHTDAAIELFRLTLPQFGFRIVVPPLLSNGVQVEASASIWRRGDAQALSWRASTPSLALLCAIEDEHVRQQDGALRAKCMRCHGVGWYVSVNGARQICQHA
jgi:hypothetical protein